MYAIQSSLSAQALPERLPVMQASPAVLRSACKPAHSVTGRASYLNEAASCAAPNCSAALAFGNHGTHPEELMGRSGRKIAAGTLAGHSYLCSDAIVRCNVVDHLAVCIDSISPCRGKRRSDALRYPTGFGPSRPRGASACGVMAIATRRPA